MTDGYRRKYRIPPDATHFIWAYQGDGVDLEALTDEQKSQIDTDSGEFAFASLGSFIYVRAGEPGDAPTVVAVNALGLGEDHRHRLGA